MADAFENVTRLLAMRLRTLLTACCPEHQKLQEIRLRSCRPFAVREDKKEYFIRSDGMRTCFPGEAYMVSTQDIRETMEYINNYSPYAFEEELRQCFITVPGGHRVGIAGRAVLENNRIKSIRNVSSINIRLAHEIKGCADRYMDHILCTNRRDIYNTLIISPPCCGKTTLLRDIVRQISDLGMRVSVVDERSEIGACYLGVPQNDIGMRTDILDCCPKAEGIMKMIRSMSPQVVAVDEIGTRDDLEAVSYAMVSGSRLLCTMHGDSLEDAMGRCRTYMPDPGYSAGHVEKLFERYIVLDNVMSNGSLKIYNRSHDRICTWK